MLIKRFAIYNKLAKMTEPLLFQRSMLSHKAVMVHCLDDEGNEIEGAYASGFLLKQRRGLFLYTCWHVVFGFVLFLLFLFFFVLFWCLFCFFFFFLVVFFFV